MAKRISKRKDVFTNAEYLIVKKNNRQLLLLEDKEINGMSRTALAKLIGNKLGEGVYHYTIKFYDNPDIKVGKITSIMSKQSVPVQITAQPNLNIFNEQIKRLEEKIEQQTTGNTNFNDIMDMKDAAYKIQIDFWKGQCEMLKSENEKLKKEVDSSGGSSVLESLAPVLIDLLTKKPA